MGVGVTLRIARLHRIEARFGASEHGGLEVGMRGVIHAV